MPVIETFRRYPPVLWALALYFCSLGFSLRVDIPLAILAFSSTFYFARVESRHSPVSHFREHWHVVFFLLAGLAATAHSRDLAHSLGVQVHWLLAVLIYVILFSATTSRREIEFAIQAVVVGGLVSGLAFLLQALHLSDVPDPLEKIYRIRSPLIVAPNDVLYFSVMAPLAVSLIASARFKIGFRLMGAAYLLMVFILTVYMQSRQAVGILFLSAVIFAALLRPRYALAVAGVGMVGILGVDWFTGGALQKKLVYLFPRRYVWAAAWQMFLDQPLLGQGPGMFRIFYEHFLEKAGYLLAHVEDRRPMNWAHSLYLEQLAERGALGLLGLLIVVFRPVWKVLTAGRGNIATLEKGLIASLAAFLLSGIAETSLLRLWAVILLFVLIALISKCESLNNVELDPTSAPD